MFNNTNKNPIINFLLIIICLLPAMWFVYDRIDLVRQSELQQATIVKCDYKWGIRTSSGNGMPRKRTSYTPIAISDQGVKVSGTLWWSSRKVCEGSLEKKVTVFIHQTDSEKNRINSFFQLWMFPSIAVFFCTVLFVGIYLPRRSWTINTPLTLAMFSLVAASYYRELHKTGEVSSGIGSVDKSHVVLEQCAADRMRKKALTNRAQIKYLLCQDSGITDLSSLDDLVNLEELYLQGNELTSLETIGPLIKLKTISVAGNKMVSLKGIGRLPSLEELQANKNQITDLSGMRHLSKLKEIGLMQNQISSIAELEHLSQLESVILNSNEITDVQPLANKPALKEVQIYSNGVTTIQPIYGNTNMTLFGVTSKKGPGSVPCKEINMLRNKLAPDANVWGEKNCNE